MLKDQIIVKIQECLRSISAAEVAELFISPYINKELLLKSTAEEGPSMWIVNRSDVYDETLQIMTEHEVKGIASRAQEKLKLRHSPIHLPPVPIIDYENAEEYEIENVLGHPQATFESIVFFSNHKNEDFRASAALSLMRRLLEYPPKWELYAPQKLMLIDHFFRMLLEDTSPMVRAYISRAPLFTKDQLFIAYQSEHHPIVKSRLLQNIRWDSDNYSKISTQVSHSTLDQIMALDERLNPNLRTSITSQSNDTLCQLIHEWYLK